MGISYSSSGPDSVPSTLQRPLNITRHLSHLQGKLIGEPLMMNSGSIDRLLNRHLKIDDVQQHLNCRRDDARDLAPQVGDPGRIGT